MRLKRYLFVLAAVFLPAELLAQCLTESEEYYDFCLCISLRDAALGNDVAGLEEQFDYGVNLDCRIAEDYDGGTPIILAARYGGAEAVTFLVENGANVNARDRRGWTALRHARAGLANAGESSERAGKFARTIAILEQANAAE